MDTNLKLKLISIAHEIKAEIYQTEQSNAELYRTTEPMIILFVDKWEDAQKASEKYKLKIGLFERYRKREYTLVSQLQEPIFGNNGSYISGDLSYRIGLYFE